MKKWLLTGLLVLPALALSQQEARAQFCYNLAGKFHVKICATGTLKGWHEKFPSCYGPSCFNNGGAGGPGGYAGGYGGGYDAGNKFAAPGPWYLYWPYAGTGGMATAQPMSFPGWTYEDNFNAPAPTGYPWWPAPTTAPLQGSTAATQLPASPYQPVGYPHYWYGH